MNALFEALTRASAFGLAALFVALIAQFTLNKRAPAAWRAWIWRIALVQSAFALLPLAPIRWEILAPPTIAPIAATPSARAKPNEIFDTDNLNSSPLEMPDAPPLENALSLENATPIESAPHVPIAQAQPALLDWRALLLAIYAFGVAFQCAQLARGKRQLRRTLRDCKLNENADLITRLNELTARSHLKIAPQLLISEGGSPFLTGIWRPRIILPLALCEAENAQLDAVLAHELAHQKRRDLIWLGATWLLQTLLWFHPLAWAARRFHGLETECACDELALQLAPIAPQSYGALLLNSMNNSKFSSPLAAGTCDTLFALKTRLMRLNNAPKAPRKMAKLAFVAALVISCVAVVPLKLVARAGDAALTKPNAGSAVVQGVVTSKQTGKPLAGVPIIFIPVLPKKISSKEIFTVNGDSEFRSNSVEGILPNLQAKQETVTDTRGYFRLNAVVSDYILLVDGRISFLSSRYTEFSAREAVVTEGNKAQRRDHEFALDGALKRSKKFVLKTLAGSAVVQGVVTSKQTKKPLANVSVTLTTTKLEANRKDKTRLETPTTQKTRTDARGYFRFNAAEGLYSLLVNGRITIVIFRDAKGRTRKSNRPLQIELDEDGSDAATPPKTTGTGNAVVQGIVLAPRTKQPLAGAPIILKNGGKSQKSVTDARGYFRFNTSGGKQVLSVSTRQPNNPADSKLVVTFELENGQKRNLRLDWDEISDPSKAVIPTNLPRDKGTGNAVTQGIITSKQSKKPLVGVTMILVAGQVKLWSKDELLPAKAKY